MSAFCNGAEIFYIIYLLLFRGMLLRAKANKKALKVINKVKNI